MNKHPWPALAGLLLLSMLALGVRHALRIPPAAQEKEDYSFQTHDEYGGARSLAPEQYAAILVAPSPNLPEVLRAASASQSPMLADESTSDWQNQTPAQLWQRWQNLLKQRNFQQIPIINALLAESMRKHPDTNVYQDIQRLLAQRNIAVQAKAILLDLLGEIATPESLTQLLRVAENQENTPLYIPALQVIARIGDNRWDGVFHEELSPPLEQAWSEPEIDDPAFIQAIANAIAALGAPTGVDRLISEIAGENRDKDSEGKKRIKQQAAFAAIPKIRNPGAVSILSGWLNTASVPADDTDQIQPAAVSTANTLATPSAVTELSGQALAEIGTPAATREILTWAGGTSGNNARLLEDWLRKIDDSESLSMIASYTTATNKNASTTMQSNPPQPPFQSAEVAAVIDRFISGQAAQPF